MSLYLHLNLPDTLVADSCGYEFAVAYNIIGQYFTASSATCI